MLNLALVLSYLSSPFYSEKGSSHRSLPGGWVLCVPTRGSDHFESVGIHARPGVGRRGVSSPQVSVVSQGSESVI